ncbi:Uncharacterised protein [Bordetella pertussis]|nr:Uncharacterised protein [Bordetella pertussis]
MPSFMIISQVSGSPARPGKQPGARPRVLRGGNQDAPSGNVSKK